MPENKPPSKLLKQLGAAIFFSILGIIGIWYAEKFLPKEVTHLIIAVYVLVAAHFIGEAFVYGRIEKHFQTLLAETIKKFNPIIEQCEASGITEVYKNREDIGDAVIKCVKKAKKRVLLLGIAFSESVALKDLADVLNRKLSVSEDTTEVSRISSEGVKILLLHAYRSPSVFRALLETEPEKVSKIIQFHKLQNDSEDPMFTTRLFKDFETAYATLGTYKIPEESIRFYAHAPTCWLVIADDTAFFQPYTFGKSEQTANMCLGAQFPVFKCTANPNSTSGNAFKILEDHFVKMWLTSSWGMMTIGAEIQDKQRLVNKIFDDRFPFLAEVSKALNSKKVGFERDRRAHPRQPCKSNLDVVIKNNGADIPATVYNYSGSGIALKITSNTGETLSTGNIITIDASNGNVTHQTSKNIRQKLLKDDQGEYRKFEVRQVSQVVEGLSIVGCSV